MADAEEEISSERLENQTPEDELAELLYQKTEWMRLKQILTEYMLKTSQELEHISNWINQEMAKINQDLISEQTVIKGQVKSLKEKLVHLAEENALQYKELTMATTSSMWTCPDFDIEFADEETVKQEPMELGDIPIKSDPVFK